VRVRQHRVWCRGVVFVAQVQDRMPQALFLITTACATCTHNNTHQTHIRHTCPALKCFDGSVTNVSASCGSPARPVQRPRKRTNTV
jgi:hypothetical protein